MRTNFDMIFKINFSKTIIPFIIALISITLFINCSSIQASDSQEAPAFGGTHGNFESSL